MPSRYADDREGVSATSGSRVTGKKAASWARLRLTAVECLAGAGERSATGDGRVACHEAAIANIGWR